MCCFSGPVLSVRATRIFARALEGERQLVVYETAFAAASDLAMVLPIPVPEGSADDAVRFVDLSNEALFFERLDIAFVSRQAPGFGAPQAAGGAYRAPPLVVHEVGEFQASFVPSRGDFGRLDPCFRLAPSVIDALGARASYGFVVVQLRKREKPVRVHPIGFTYPTRDPARLFFPTVHVHDGEVHAEADFDHVLYTTDGARVVGFDRLGSDGGARIPRRARAERTGYGGEPTRDPRPAEWLSAKPERLVTSKDGTTVLPRDATVYRAELSESRTNDDTWLELGPEPVAREVVEALAASLREGRVPATLQFFVSLREQEEPLLAKLGRKLTGRARRFATAASVRPTESGEDRLFWLSAASPRLEGPPDAEGRPSLLVAIWPHGLAPLSRVKDVSDWAEEWAAKGSPVPEAALTWARANVG